MNFSTSKFPLDGYNQYKMFFRRSAGGLAPKNPLFVGRIICTYVIECSERPGEGYVGSTEDFRVRWGHHRNRLNYGNHVNTLMSDAIEEHGIETFTIRILKMYDTTVGLLRREQIDAFENFDERNLWNGVTGGRQNFNYPRQRRNAGPSINPGRNKKVRWIKGETA